MSKVILTKSAACAQENNSLQMELVKSLEDPYAHFNLLLTNRLRIFIPGDESLLLEQDDLHHPAEEILLLEVWDILPQDALLLEEGDLLSRRRRSTIVVTAFVYESAQEKKFNVARPETQLTE